MAGSWMTLLWLRMGPCRCKVHQGVTVSRGRGKRNRSAKGPVGRRAAPPRRVRSSDAQWADWPLHAPGPGSLAEVVKEIPGVDDGVRREDAAVGTARASVGIS